MAGYGVAYAQETRLDQTGRPRHAECSQCEDTGFVRTSAGLKHCPMCEDDSEQDRRAGKRG